MRRLILILGLLAAPALPAAAAEIGGVITGKAVALDGDTLWLEDQRVRLWGIDAPEMNDWPWGAWARGRLDSLLLSAKGEVHCGVIDLDRHKRPVAICKTVPEGKDLSLVMLRAGFAVVYRRFTVRALGDMIQIAALYNASEYAARGERLGIWERCPSC